MFTEFISSEGLIRDAWKSKQKLDIFEYERPIGIQIFGSDIDHMREAAQLAEAADPDIIEKLRQQDAALDDEHGALLWAVSALDGEKLAEFNLDSQPVFDGMIAANGRLYLATKDGRITCLDGSN